MKAKYVSPLDQPRAEMASSGLTLLLTVAVYEACVETHRRYFGMCLRQYLDYLPNEEQQP